MKVAVVVVVMGGLVGACVHAEESPWSIRSGVAHVRFSAGADVAIGGSAVPGGTVSSSSNDTLSLNIGYRFAPDWHARLLVGVPPTTTVRGAGALAGAGVLGKVKYGPAVLTATYDLDRWGALRPYIGAGINYTIVFESRDGALSGLKVDSAWGSVLQLGAEADLANGWLLSFDVRKIFLKTNAYGTVGAGGPAASARVSLNPAVVTLQVGRRF